MMLGMAVAMAACTDWSSIDWKEVAETTAGAVEVVAAGRGVTPGSVVDVDEEPGVAVLAGVIGPLDDAIL
jgi:hypothetical protein